MKATLILILALLIPALSFADSQVIVKNGSSTTGDTTTLTHTVLFQPLTGIQAGIQESYPLTLLASSIKHALLVNGSVENFYTNFTFDVLGYGTTSQEYECSNYLGYTWYKAWGGPDIEIDAGAYTYWMGTDPGTSWKNTTVNGTLTLTYHW